MCTQPGEGQSGSRLSAFSGRLQRSCCCREAANEANGKPSGRHVPEAKSNNGSLRSRGLLLEKCVVLPVNDRMPVSNFRAQPKARVQAGNRVRESWFGL